MYFKNRNKTFGFFTEEQIFYVNILFSMID